MDAIFNKQKNYHLPIDYQLPFISGVHWHCSGVNQLSDQSDIILDQQMGSNMTSCQGSCLLSLECKSIIFDLMTSNCQRMRVNMYDTGAEISTIEATSVACELGNTLLLSK